MRGTMTTWKGPRTKIETWRNWRSDGQTERGGHMGKRAQTGEKQRGREREDAQKDSEKPEKKPENKLEPTYPERNKRRG